MQLNLEVVIAYQYIQPKIDERFCIDGNTMGGKGLGRLTLIDISRDTMRDLADTEVSIALDAAWRTRLACPTVGYEAGL